MIHRHYSILSTTADKLKKQKSDRDESLIGKKYVRNGWPRNKGFQQKL